MKHQAIQYLALDVHKATTTATARDEAGNVRMRRSGRRREICSRSCALRFTGAGRTQESGTCAANATACVRCRR